MGLPRKLRPEVLQFAQRMEMKLREHDHDRGDSFKDMTIHEVERFLERECSELDEALVRWKRQAISGANPVRLQDRAGQAVFEIADVANGLMFQALYIMRTTRKLGGR